MHLPCAAQIDTDARTARSIRQHRHVVDKHTLESYSPGCHDEQNCVSLSGLRLVIIALQGYSTSCFCLCSNFLHSAAFWLFYSSSLYFILTLFLLHLFRVLSLFIYFNPRFYSVRLTLTSVLSTSVLLVFIVPCLHNLLQVITKPFRDFLEANASPCCSAREKL